MKFIFIKKVKTEFIKLTPSEALDKILPSYKRYYNIKTTDVIHPFAAEAEFHSHNEQYILVKAAKIADIDANEYVFFATEENLTEEKITDLAAAAWKNGQERITPVYGHRNSDVTLVILTAGFNISDELIEKKIKQTKYSASYKMGMYGWSNFRLIVLNTQTGKSYTNWQGRDLKKIIKL